jgi:hypothetical protein
MNKKDYKITKKHISFKEINGQKLDLISGLTGKNVSDIVNEILESNKTIDEVLEESKKNSNLL